MNGWLSLPSSSYKRSSPRCTGAKMLLVFLPQSGRNFRHTSADRKQVLVLFHNHEDEYKVAQHSTEQDPVLEVTHCAPARLEVVALKIFAGLPGRNPARGRSPGLAHDWGQGHGEVQALPLRPPEGGAEPRRILQEDPEGHNHPVSVPGTLHFNINCIGSKGSLDQPE